MLPCSEVHWKILPAICRQLALSMEKEGVPRARMADALGMTPAAVSQYISGKRGGARLNGKAIGACRELAGKIAGGKVGKGRMRQEITAIVVLAKGSALGKSDVCHICAGK